MNVGQPASSKAWLQRGEAMTRDVEGIQAPRVPHLSAEGERLAAGAGAEVDHHLAASGAGHQRQQLAAFLLDLDPAVDVDLELVQRGLALDPDPDRRMRRRRGGDNASRLDR